MFNNRKFINELIKENEKLKIDIESKENTVCNVLDANKELSLSNNYLEKRVNQLKTVIKRHEENECRLNTKLCRAEGKLDKIKNMYRLLTGEELE